MRYLTRKLTRLKGFVIGAALLSAPAWLAAASSIDEIIVVKSSDNVYFDKSVTTLINHADKSLPFRVLMPEQLNTDTSESDGSRLYITFGAVATNAVKQLDADARVISAYLTFEQYRQLAIDNQLAVLLDQPLHRYLAFCRLLLDLDSVGIILEEDLEDDPPLVSGAREYDLNLNQYRLDADNKLIPLLRELLQENDALLMLPRQAIYNPDSLKAVLLTSYRNHKPVISYSPAHVRAGALASIYSSPVDIGRHLAQIVNQRLEHPSARSVGFEYAMFYTIATNPSVAQALAITLRDEGELRSSLDRVKP
jgi:hypothetical protein